MAKPKRSTGGSGLRKPHGPKKHLFKDFKPMVWAYSSGVLNKYNNEESFILSCQARGCKSAGHGDWLKYCILKTTAEKDEYLKALRK